MVVGVPIDSEVYVVERPVGAVRDEGADRAPRSFGWAVHKAPGSFYEVLGTGKVVFCSDINIKPSEPPCVLPR